MTAKPTVERMSALDAAFLQVEEEEPAASLAIASMRRL